MDKHPAFVLAEGLPEPLRSHFPKSQEGARDWKPMVIGHALAQRVLAVARTRVECAWAAYIDAVPGYDHGAESEAVLDHGDKLPERIARTLFPLFDAVPYAD